MHYCIFIDKTAGKRFDTERYDRVALQQMGLKQESPADARVTLDTAVIPRWPSAAILDFIEPQIAPFDLLTPKTLA